MSIVEWIIALLFSVIALILAVKMSGLDQRIGKKTRPYGYFFGKEPRTVYIRDSSYWGYDGVYEVDRTRGSYDEENHILYLKEIDQPLTDVTLWPKEGANLVPAHPSAMMIGDTDIGGNELELMGPTENPIEKVLAKKYAGSVNKPTHTWLDQRRTSDLAVMTTIKGEETQQDALQSGPQQEERFVKKLGDTLEKVSKITRPMEKPPR